MSPPARGLDSRRCCDRMSDMSTAATYLHTLVSGTVIHILAATGRSLGPATPIPGGCPDLVEVPSGHPEPDFPSDLWITRPCGAPMFETHGNPNGRTCTDGHTYRGLEAESAIDAAVEMLERAHGRDADPAEAAQLRDLVS
jgi:hypothetical protein